MYYEKFLDIAEVLDRLDALKSTRVSMRNQKKGVVHHVAQDDVNIISMASASSGQGIVPVDDANISLPSASSGKNISLASASSGKKKII